MDKAKLISALAQIVEESASSNDRSVLAATSILCATLGALKAPAVEIEILMEVCANYCYGMIHRAETAGAGKPREVQANEDEFPPIIGA